MGPVQVRGIHREAVTRVREVVLEIEVGVRQGEGEGEVVLLLLWLRIDRRRKMHRRVRRQKLNLLLKASLRYWSYAILRNRCAGADLYEQLSVTSGTCHYAYHVRTMFFAQQEK
jgi:hypothetical protein